MSTRKLILPFLFFTFLLTWGIAALIFFFPDFITKYTGEVTVFHPLYFLAVYSPSIVAISLVCRFYGKQQCLAFIRRIIKWRIGSRPFVLAVAFVLGAHFLIRFIELTYNLGTPELPYKWFMFVPLAILYLFIDAGPIGEELGWRGFLLPLMQQKMSSIPASIVVGFIWACWHLPAFFISATNQNGKSILLFFLVLISLNMLITQIYNLSNGSVLITVIMHWMLNLSVYLHITGNSFVSSALIIVIFTGATLFIKIKYNPDKVIALIPD